MIDFKSQTMGFADIFKGLFIELNNEGISMIRNIVLSVSVVSVLFGCGSKTPFITKEYSDWNSITPADTNIFQTVILIGDGGEPELEKPDPVLTMLRAHLTISNNQRPDSLIEVQSAAPQTPSLTRGKIAKNVPMVAFLGDNIYQFGLPPEGDDDREEMEKKLTRQIDVVKESGGRLLFIPGNHDWNRSRPGGLEAVIREQEFVEKYLDTTDVFLPKNACAGPVALELNDDIVLIAIDSEWWLTNEARAEAPDNNCGTESEFDFLIRLEDMLDDYDDRNIVLLMHHPVFSNSNHGGHYSLGDNIFPLRLINPKWMIPLPVIGSVYPLLRKYGVSRQDIPHPKYQELITGLLAILEERTNIVVASGHDHNLQLKIHESMPFVVSGSASKVNFVARARKTEFTHQSLGFAKLIYYQNGDVWIEFWQPHPDTPMGERTYMKLLYSFTEKEAAEDPQSRINYQDSVKYLAAGPEYAASGFKKFWLGKHYRDVWTTPVKINYLDLDTEAGGLVPLQKGGGKQTISLRLQNKEEIQYSLRSVNKDPKGVIPEPLHGTFAESLVKDQISSAHPYGALVIPSLANAAEIYHTSPKLFFVPNDYALGRFRFQFAEMMALLEIRPDEDLSQFRRFGFSENVVSTNTLWQELRSDNDNKVDPQQFLRSRLFDMVIGDWDRHEDQWRWAEFENEEKGSLYRPVPRDRDQVFTKFDGIIPWLATRRWMERGLEHFDHHFQDIVGLNMSAEILDRRLLNELTWNHWEKEIEIIQVNLSDSVIDEAVKQMPKAAYDISGPEIASKLKSRRDILGEAVKKYYHALSREVDITGSEKHEYFLVHRLENGHSDVKVFKTGKEGNIDKLIYHRDFDPAETKELRLFTLGGKDSILVKGNARNAIKLRLIGGNDENVIIDRSTGGKVLVYENVLENNKIITGKQTKVKASKSEFINDFDPEEYQYPYVGPRLSVEFNPDDGFFLGAGIYWNTYGFRRKPHKSEHLILGHVATATGGYDVRYQGTYYSIFGRNWDLSLSGQNFSPKYVFNYFGEGNGTVQEEGIDYYRISMRHLALSSSVNYRFSDVFKVGFGPVLNYFDPVSRPNNITSSDDFDAPEDLASTYFAGTKFFLDLNLVDYVAYPRRGIKWFNEWTYLNELGGSDNFHRLKSDLAFYVTPNLPVPVTVAVRFGVAANIGSYKFYQSNFLGNNENLRGYRKTRYAGKTAFYQNTEVRIGLSKINNYFFRGYWGVLGFIDHGRVWTDGQGVLSNEWKRGYGPGIWFNLFKKLTISMEYGISKEDDLFTLNFGLQY